MDITRTALVPYSALDMYRLVENVPDYPEFLSWCTGATVLEQTECEQVARLEVSVAGINRSFTTRNSLEPGTSLAMRLVDGPFDLLEGKWTFNPLGADGCKVALHLAFETSGPFRGVFGKGFARIADRLVADFSHRADEVYGRERRIGG